MAKRTYEGKAPLPAERNWDLWQILHDQLLQGFTPDTYDYSATMDGGRGGRAVSEDFADLRATVEPEGENVLRVESLLLRHNPKLTVHFQWYRIAADWCRVSISSESEPEALGWAAALDRTIQIWLIQPEGAPRQPPRTPKSEPTIVPTESPPHPKSEPVIVPVALPPQPNLWRRIVHQPNPWVLYIGAGAIAGLIVWWLTTR